jgi:hypothetical protein
MRIILPQSPAPVFAWSSDAIPPPIPLSTDQTGPHQWKWTLTWKTFSATGTLSTPTNQWDASEAVAAGGGSLTIVATANGQSATATIKVTGINPISDQLSQFLATQPNGAGFAKILQHESACHNFGSTGEPIVSFDHGYGMCQLTTPQPTFVQAWNWKSNVLGGLALFAAKYAVATAYLQQGGRTCSDNQLLYESVSLWNGGHYHVWSADGWIRNPNMLCDTKTGNIGWDMTDPLNTGKTEVALHKRDAAQYNKPPSPKAHWKYSGVCYADRILG